MSLYQRLIGMFDDEQDPEYVPLVTRTPLEAAIASWGTPKKVASDVFIHPSLMRSAH